MKPLFLYYESNWKIIWEESIDIWISWVGCLISLKLLFKYLIENHICLQMLLVEMFLSSTLLTLNFLFSTFLFICSLLRGLYYMAPKVYPRPWTSVHPFDTCTIKKLDVISLLCHYVNVPFSHLINPKT